METEKQITLPAKLLQRIVFDCMLIGLYLSFVIFTAIDFSKVGWAPHNEHQQEIFRSLSGIGWRVGALGRLAFYTFFTIGFFIYQMRLFTKLSVRKHLVINWVMIIGSVFLLAGSSLPVSGQSELLVDILHGIFCQVGTVMMVTAVGLMVIAYCRETKTSKNAKARVYVPYIVMVLIGALGLVTTGSDGVLVSAMFSLMATFMAMIYLNYLTVCFELAPKLLKA